MKMCIASLFAAGIVMNGLAESIQLPAPALAGGLTVMQALQARHSERSFSDAELSPQELSGLLWAANGFNRPDKRTNATGMNKQTIVLFVCMKSGARRRQGGRGQVARRDSHAIPERPLAQRQAPVRAAACVKVMPAASGQPRKVQALGVGFGTCTAENPSGSLADSGEGDS